MPPKGASREGSNRRSIVAYPVIFDRTLDRRGQGRDHEPHSGGHLPPAQPIELRHQARQARTRPLVEELHVWMSKTLAKISRKSDTAVAIRYALSRWRALTRYIDNGLIELDNSAAERALRGVALGRKNYLFAGSDAGGERAACLYSLLGTAKLNGLDPELYLRELLGRIGDHPINRISELLPWNLASSLLELG